MLRNFRDSIARRRQIRRTHSELSALTDRELNDIGISRGDIRRISLSV